jgi:hypothetical protein
MIIIQKQKLNLNPTIDLQNSHHVCDDLLEAISEHVTANAQKIVYKGTPLKAFFISGFAKEVNQSLQAYLNSHVMGKHKLKLDLVSGQFASYPLTHHWLKAKNLIIDLAISQFANKNIKTQNQLRPFINSHVFISDNPQNSIYRLYRAA